MIVEDQLDRSMGRIGGVDELEEFNKFAAAVAVLDEGVDLAGEQIDAGQQADRSVALVLVVAREGRMSAGLGRQVRGCRGDCLNAGLLILVQNLRHLLPELRVAAFQVIADPMRLYLLLIEDFAQRALSQLGKASVPLRRPML